MWPQPDYLQPEDLLTSLQRSTVQRAPPHRLIRALLLALLLLLLLLLLFVLLFCSVVCLTSGNVVVPHGSIRNVAGNLISPMAQHPLINLAPQHLSMAKFGQMEPALPASLPSKGRWARQTLASSSLPTLPQVPSSRIEPIGSAALTIQPPKCQSCQFDHPAGP